MKLEFAIKKGMHEGLGVIARPIGSMKVRYIRLAPQPLASTESYGPLGGLSPLEQWQPTVEDFDAEDWEAVPPTRIAAASEALLRHQLAPAEKPYTLADARESLCKAICNMAADITLPDDAVIVDHLAAAVETLVGAQINLSSLKKEE